MFLRQCEDLVQQNDIIIVADFGHGALTHLLREILCNQNKFLAINTQCNAGNNMMHTISKYRRADYVCITEKELRIEAKDNQTHIRSLIEIAAERIGARCFSVTRGKQGLCIFKPKDTFLESPALTIKTTDTVGAGDAVLSISALAAYASAPAEMIAFFGNVAGAMASQTIGNSEPVNRIQFEKFITALLK
jgi:bifunctional ADP-heptose synthase (sugar kinase/adenylyltransferase)